MVSSQYASVSLSLVYARRDGWRCTIFGVKRWMCHLSTSGGSGCGRVPSSDHTKSQALGMGGFRLSPSPSTHVYLGLRRRAPLGPHTVAYWTPRISYTSIRPCSWRGWADGVSRPACAFSDPRPVGLRLLSFHMNRPQTMCTSGDASCWRDACVVGLSVRDHTSGARYNSLMMVYSSPFRNTAAASVEAVEEGAIDSHPVNVSSLYACCMLIMVPVAESSHPKTTTTSHNILPSTIQRRRGGAGMFYISG